MDITWDENQPIYLQLMAEIVGWILDGSLTDGDALPSIRAVAQQFQVNPLTASKAYQELSGADVLEKRRGIGLFIRQGARDRLVKSEREKFLNEEWPEIIARVRRMDLDAKDLFDGSF